MKFLSHIITAIALGIYYVLLSVLLFHIKDISVWWSIPLAIGYALFMIITLGAIFARFPEPLQKYFRNKTPDNPDGCG